MPARPGENPQVNKKLTIIQPQVVKGHIPEETVHSAVEFTDNSGVWNNTWQNRRLGIVEQVVGSDGTCSLQIISYSNIANSSGGAKLLLTAGADGSGSISFNGGTVLQYPSGTTKNLTLGDSGNYYTAPADGWFLVDKVSSGASQYLMVVAGNYQDTRYSSASGQRLRVTFPAKKGQSVGVSYSLGGDTKQFMFIYAS